MEFKNFKIYSDLDVDVQVSEEAEKHPANKGGTSVTNEKGHIKIIEPELMRTDTRMDREQFNIPAAFKGIIL